MQVAPFVTAATCFVAALPLTGFGGGLGSTALGQTLTVQTVATGLTKPVFLTHAPGDPTRLFVVEQRGIIKVIKNGTVQATPFLNIDSQVPEQTYSGMLGIAFHPNYQKNRKFYVHHTTGTSSAITVNIREFTAIDGNPDQADPASGKTILKLNSPSTQGFHLGGWIGFGPDNYLYIPLGDGGYTGDPQGPPRSQNLVGQWWGKILRVDVDGDDFPADATRNYAVPPTNPFVGVAGDDEIWMRGLRNPFRASFDRATGWLYVGDVGGTAREEIDVLTPASAGGNGGWNCTEGFLCASNANCSCPSVTLTTPIYDYNHSVGQSITGGAVYRGCAMPDLDGTYFFADYQANKAFSLRWDGTAVSEFTNRTASLGTPNTPVAIGEDYYGELYLVLHTPGQIKKIVPTPASPDADGDGIPDSCESPLFGDINGDGHVDGADLSILLGAWGASVSPADLNHDGTVDSTDLALLLGAWQ
ncbi:MAG: PQQ-dependent sugar dehydrogenase [Phycisphaerae bacterium]|jgi:glucose/arabinose dehydrogenase|nr:PQQ-dependent sugar dehydrogenase [Phycisphaerae bacterium]